MYLVAACTDTSTPWSNDAEVERRRPGVVEHDLRAAARGRPSAIAGMSCTSKVSDPGDSVNTMLVFGRNSRSIAAPASGS